MKLEQKAYKVSFPSWCESTKDLWSDPTNYDVIYGESQKAALNRYCKEFDGLTYFELKTDARTRRFKEADVYRQEPSELLKDLSKQEINHLTHSLGVEVADNCTVEFYRN